MNPARLRLGIVTPSPPRSRHGNRVTALRWAGLLRRLGHQPFIEEEWSGRSCDALIALHALKSCRSAERFAKRNPRSPLIVVLTGTDIYSELPTNGAAPHSAEEILAAATRIVVLQPETVAAIPERWREKVRVVRQSASPPRARSPVSREAFEVVVAAHLREIKDPFRAAQAARAVKASSRLRILHAGEALSEPMRAAAEREMAENPRYRWLGVLPHRRTVELIAGSRALLVTSRSEGGANVVSEAIAAGVPVLSSQVPGSIGVLGAAYPGFFEIGDTEGLARLLERFEEDARFQAGLAAWCARLQPLVAPQREQDALSDLLLELFPAREPDESSMGSSPRVRVLGAELELPFVRLAADVALGLREEQKRLPCCWFYDEQGSHLFEEICALPEYYLTRTEDAILEQNADAIVAAASSAESLTLVELGSGSAVKTRRLIEALLKRRLTLRYVMIDISRSTLEASARTLAERYPQIEIVGVCAEYQDGLARLPELAPPPRLLLWLGSNIGNFHRQDAARFLSDARARLDSRDEFLIGVDLRKDPRTLVEAYDDQSGVTARFNLNLLARVNRELGGHFDLGAFRHEASYHEADGRIEMWLVSERAQSVAVDLLDMTVAFAPGERVHTENSYKYSLEEIDALAAEAGLLPRRKWLDREKRFAEVLFSIDPGRASLRKRDR